jgi:hypothetical protein
LIVVINYNLCEAEMAETSFLWHDIVKEWKSKATGLGMVYLQEARQ